MGGGYLVDSVQKVHFVICYFCIKFGGDAGVYVCMYVCMFVRMRAFE